MTYLDVLNERYPEGFRISEEYEVVVNDIFVHAYHTVHTLTADEIYLMFPEKNEDYKNYGFDYEAEPIVEINDEWVYF